MSNIKLDDETRLKFNELLKESDASDNTEKLENLNIVQKLRNKYQLC